MCCLTPRVRIFQVSVFVSAPSKLRKKTHMFYVSQDVYNYLWRMADGPATLSVEDVQNDLGRTKKMKQFYLHVAISSMVVGSGYTMVYLDLAGRFCRWSDPGDTLEILRSHWDKAAWWTIRAANPLEHTDSLQLRRSLPSQLVGRVLSSMIPHRFQPMLSHQLQFEDRDISLRFTIRHLKKKRDTNVRTWTMSYLQQMFEDSTSSKI